MQIFKRPTHFHIKYWKNTSVNIITYVTTEAFKDREAVTGREGSIQSDPKIWKPVQSNRHTPLVGIGFLLMNYLLFFYITIYNILYYVFLYTYVYV